MQLLAQFKKNSVHGVQSHLKFFTLNKLCQKLHLILLIKIYNKKKFHRAVFEIYELKAKIKMFLAGHIVAMVTYCVMKIISTCSPRLGSFLIP